MEKRKLLTIPGLELRPLGRPVAKPTALSRLLNQDNGYLKYFFISAVGLFGLRLLLSYCISPG
jgi:hypothetical protein